MCSMSLGRQQLWPGGKVERDEVILCHSFLKAMYYMICCCFLKFFFRIPKTWRIQSLSFSLLRTQSCLRIEATAKAFPNELALMDDGSGTTYSYQDTD